jgi:ABC-2 type transport system ATP-binding protein
VTRQDFWQLVIRLVAPPTSDPFLNDGEEDKGRGVAVLITTPYMDEAARCHRVGFMRKGSLIADGAPSEQRAWLDGRIVELRGRPLPLLRQIAVKEDGVEDVRAFGDRLHLRVVAAQAEDIIQRLREAIRAAGGTLDEARSIPATLEDVFIALSENINNIGTHNLSHV